MDHNETHYERNPDFIFRMIVNEAVLVPIHQNVADMDSIYTLNSLGAFIWERLKEPMTLVELQVAVSDEYAAEPQNIAADLETFLQEMVSIGAIRRF